MKSNLIIAAAAVMVIAVATPQGSIAFAQDAGAKKQESTMPKADNMQQGGNMSQGGKKHKGGKGGGMMGQGGMMGRMAKMRKKMMGKMFVVRSKPYSNADIKRMIDGRLAKNGFSNLLAGDVKDGAKEKAALVNVVSPKGEFLFKVRVNRKTGMAVIVE